MAVMEKQLGLRIGVAALDTGNGNSIFYRESERFLMCSTFKVMLVAATLARVDAGQRESGSRGPLPEKRSAGLRSGDDEASRPAA